LYAPNRTVWQPTGIEPIEMSATVTWPDSTHFTTPVNMITTRMPTGGLRAWLLCPSCGRRCGRLHLVDENDREFRCRLCLNLAYRVQYRKSMRDGVFRLVRKWLAELNDGPDARVS
jgi:hypothetical protein